MYGAIILSLSSSWGSNWLYRITGWFKGSRDSVSRNIRDALVVLDRMASFIDSAKKNLENMYEEHRVRAKAVAEKGKREYEEIFLEELKHISSLISMFSKVHYDIMRVRYRLETITAVEEPMRLLPEIIQELEAIKPEVERIAPELATMLLEVERKVNSVMSSSDIASLSNMINASKGKSVKEKAVKENLPPLPPSEEPINDREALEPEPVALENNVPLSVVKKWVLEEIKSNGGVFVISDFVKKYGVPTHVVRMALKKLEMEGYIKSR